MCRWMTKGVFGAAVLVGLQSFVFAKELEGSANRPFLLPPGMRQPNRICEPIGNVPSPDGQWVVFLRRAEWDERGYRIPYMLTEVWVREVKTGQERRVLDYTRLSSKWTRRLGRKETTFRRAGGFTFQFVAWSPSSKALALQAAGDEEVCWGSVVIDLERDRVIEIAEGIQLRWSSDGAMVVGCESCFLGCPSGLVMVDLRSGQVQHHFSGVDMDVNHGWISATEYAFNVVLKGRGGWWKYEPAKGEATLTPLDAAPIILPEPTPWVQTWRPLGNRRYRGCEH